jgi:hypothetical protein
MLDPCMGGVGGKWGQEAPWAPPMPRTIEIEAKYATMYARDDENAYEHEKKGAAQAQPMSTTLEIEVQCAAVRVRDDENRRSVCCVVA